MNQLRIIRAIKKPIQDKIAFYISPENQRLVQKLIQGFDVILRESNPRRGTTVANYFIHYRDQDRYYESGWDRDCKKLLLKKHIGHIDLTPSGVNLAFKFEKHMKQVMNEDKGNLIKRNRKYKSSNKLDRFRSIIIYNETDHALIERYRHYLKLYLNSIDKDIKNEIPLR